MGKKNISRHKPTKKSNKDNHTISSEKKDELEELFLMGGISSYMASRRVGIDPRTASIYFEDWAERLVEDEDHIPWATKEKYARARYKQGITKRIIKIETRLSYFQTRLTNIISKEIDGKRIATESPNEAHLEKYERYVRITEIQLTELQQEYAVIDMMPPTEVLLKKEIERMISETHTA